MASAWGFCFNCVLRLIITGFIYDKWDISINMIVMTEKHEQKKLIEIMENYAPVKMVDDRLGIRRFLENSFMQKSELLGWIWISLKIMPANFNMKIPPSILLHLFNWNCYFPKAKISFQPKNIFLCFNTLIINAIITVIVIVIYIFFCWFFFFCRAKVTRRKYINLFNPIE